MTTTQDWSDFSLMSLFRLEAETQVAVLNEHLLLLESQGTVPPESIDTLMRAAHSIKGAARIVQVDTVVKIAHALEDLFVAVGQGAIQLGDVHVDLLLQASDFILRLSERDETDLASNAAVYAAEAEPLVQALESLPRGEPTQVAVNQLDANQINAKAINTAELTAEPDAIAFADYLSLQDSVDRQSIPEDVVPDILETSADDSVAVDGSADDSADDAVDNAPSDSASSARMIRMGADNLNRLMGLAGESLVESNWLQPFAASLLQLKQQQRSVLSRLEKLMQQDAEAAQRGDYSAKSLSEKTTTHTAENAKRALLSEAIGGVQSCHTLLSEQLSDLELFSRRFGQLSDRLYREVIASHMCDFETGTKGYSRLVRDTAKGLGKQVKLVIEGLGTQVDRDILEKLDAPITHLLTNAIAHGIEPPDVRLAAGKAPHGTIRIAARHHSGTLLITVEDDGAGIDFEALRRKVIHQSMTAPEVAAELSHAELIEFLFLPGFSTATRVDKLAGRGYGLDIARNMVQSFGGTLQAVSLSDGHHRDNNRVGRTQGTRFEFHLPLTLSVVRSLLLEIGGEPYAIGLSRIGRVLKLSPQQMHYSEGRPYFSLDREDGCVNLSVKSPGNGAVVDSTIAENISLVSARQLLDLPMHTVGQLAKSEEIRVVIVGEPGNRYGLWVDNFLEERDLVVRPLDPRLGKVPNVSSAALTEKGEPILILDVADVLRSAETLAASAVGQSMPASKGRSKHLSEADLTEDSTDSSISSIAAQKRVLVVDDSMTVRAMEKKLLQNRGYAVDIAVNGAEGWNAVRMNPYDLVVTDIDMPRMNGIELIEHMRAYGPTQKLPVIIVSYKDRAEDQMAGLNAGANYYLTKSSFHDDGLITAVTDLIGHAAGHSEVGGA